VTFSTKSALKGWRFQDIEDIPPKKSDNTTENYSTTGVPKNVSNSGSIVVLSAWVVKGSTSKLTTLSKF
jgi:hypothetical protein